MCNKYSDNHYSVLWILHLIMVLTLFIGCNMRYAICKKFIGFLLIIFHSFWLVGDIMCYTPELNSVFALFSGMYITILITAGGFDGLLVYCKCWGKEEPVLDKLLKQIEEEEKEKAIDKNILV